MIMSSTYTRTASATYTRMSLLILQVKITLRRTTKISEERLRRTFETGLKEKLIGKIHIYALDKNERCRAQLTLEIDWKRHELHIREGREYITIDNRWENNTAIELDEIIRLFNEYTQAKRLNTIWRLNYAPNVDTEYARKKLDLVDGKLLEWYGRKESYVTKIQELDECKVGLYLSYQDEH